MRRLDLRLPGRPERLVPFGRRLHGSEATGAVPGRAPEDGPPPGADADDPDLAPALRLVVLRTVDKNVAFAPGVLPFHFADFPRPHSRETVEAHHRRQVRGELLPDRLDGLVVGRVDGLGFGRCGLKGGDSLYLRQLGLSPGVAEVIVQLA